MLYDDLIQQKAGGLDITGTVDIGNSQYLDKDQMHARTHTHTHAHMHGYVHRRSMFIKCSGKNQG